MPLWPWHDHIQNLQPLSILYPSSMYELREYDLLSLQIQTEYFLSRYSKQSVDRQALSHSM